MSLSRRTWFRRLMQGAAALPLTSAFQPGKSRAGAAESPAQAGELSLAFPREKVATVADWKALVARRPVFSVDYFIGYPSVYVDQRADWSYDLEKITHYADRIIFRGASIDPKYSQDWLVSPQLVALPDLFDQAAVTRWVADTRQRWAPLLARFKKYGMRAVPIAIYFNPSGMAGYTPDWYRRRVPDYEEVPASAHTHEWAKRLKEMTCLAHPMLYEVAERYWKLVAQVMDDQAFLAVCVENEPTLPYRFGYRAMGGNPHTKKLFREFLRERHGDINLFNQVAGTGYRNFDEVDIGTDNWLVYLYAQRYRHWLVHGYYMRKLIEGLRRNTRLMAFTRLWPAYNTALCGVDLSYVQDMMPDVVSFTFAPQAVDTRKPGEVETDTNYRRDRLGGIAVYGGLLRGVGRPFGITEPLFDRGFGLTVARDYEFQHLVYRGLYYRMGFFNIHSWSRLLAAGQPGNYPPYNFFFGLSHSHWPRLMKMIHQTREELDRIAPYATFGAPVPPPVAILVTRNSTYLPGLGESFYGDFCYRLGKLMEEPEWCQAEVIEEHDRTLAARLKDCKGVVVVGCGFETETRRLLGEMVGRGVKVLWLSPPCYVTPQMAPTEPESWLPVAGYAKPVDWATLDKGDLVTWITGPWLKPDPAKVAAITESCEIKATHPALENLAKLQVFLPAELRVRGEAQTVLVNGRGEPIGAAHDNVAFIAGMPMDVAQQRTLYVNFLRWCGLQPPGVVISTYEHATVVQHYDPRNENADGEVRGAAWRGEVPLQDDRRVGLWEARRDMPWLAYRHADGRTIIEGVKLEPLEVAVFRKEESAGQPHFESLTPGVGIENCWYDAVHVLVELTVGGPTELRAEFNPARWGDKPFRWFVFRQGEARPLAEGSKRAIRFPAEPGVKYLLGSRYVEGHLDESCSLCSKGRFR